LQPIIARKRPIPASNAELLMKEGIAFNDPILEVEDYDENEKNT